MQGTRDFWMLTDFSFISSLSELKQGSFMSFIDSVFSVPTVKHSYQRAGNKRTVKL